MKKGRIVAGVVGVMVIVVAGVATMNREWIEDWWRGKDYQPTEGMAEIMTNLDLTGRGEFLFKASQPKLSSEEEFNAKCRKGDEEIAVLGCYTDGTIYVYKIDAPELNGIMETTAAHELLHAVFARMSEQEKEALKPSLTKVLEDNQEILAEDLKNYKEEQQYEELYVRAGTEIKKLPEDLEEHYAKVFDDQDKVVRFYEKYISVFRALKQEMDELESEMTGIKAEIDAMTAEYESVYDELQAEITNFNNCAGTAGCFTAAEFEAGRNDLIARQDLLNAEYEAINDLIEEYNEKVEIYNNDVLRGKNLNEIINSNKKAEVVE